MDVALEHLSVSVAGKLVCQGLELRIADGERWALLGVNGVGKTTLLHAMAGLRRADEGKVSVGGTALEALPARDRARRIGLMVQDDRDDAETSVLDVALLGRLPHLAWWQAESAADELLARDALERVGLAGMAARRAATLSGGERRRLALASLIVQQTPVLLLDEPTSHLDMHQQIALLDLMRGLPGRTLAMSLHDVNLAARYCTHALLLFGDGDCCSGPIDAMLDDAVLTRLYRHSVRRHETADGPAFLPLAGTSGVPTA